MHPLLFIPSPTGQGRPFYQWSRAVQIRTNLDLVLDWLQGAGLGDIATEFFRKLSMAVNLLCVPRTSLLKVSPDPWLLALQPCSEFSVPLGLPWVFMLFPVPAQTPWKMHWQLKGYIQQVSKRGCIWISVGLVNSFQDPHPQTY